ncbi:MAG: hypothetical protein KDC54_18185 [Lewinella sp.]|nr:hypothetical protein [Lewinella sp.]
MIQGVKIACPKCHWEPQPHSRWICEPKCRHKWNTFSTGGRCPRCSKQWEYTCCLACHRWSPHLDWYHDLDEVLDELLREQPAEKPQS